ncbi:hypothetical protein H9P43_004562 [Blastocladiella emersonii ATCC 22665]|nr:hypothetical protein H9P43_004562 [Blastocladiella emersonii ATCC 22665]
MYPPPSRVNEHATLVRRQTRPSPTASPTPLAGAPPPGENSSAFALVLANVIVAVAILCIVGFCHFRMRYSDKARMQRLRPADRRMLDALPRDATAGTLPPYAQLADDSLVRDDEEGAAGQRAPPPDIVFASESRRSSAGGGGTLPPNYTTVDRYGNPTTTLPRTPSARPSLDRGATLSLSDLPPLPPSPASTLGRSSSARSLLGGMLAPPPPGGAPALSIIEEADTPMIAAATLELGDGANASAASLPLDPPRRL